MLNWLSRSLCRECHSRKRDVENDWCSNCLTERDRHIDLYINAVLALRRPNPEKDVGELVNTAVKEIRALPPGGVVLALQDTLRQLEQQGK